MYQGMNHGTGRGIRVMQGTVLAGLLGWGAFSLAQAPAAAAKMPDAQVEANVLKALASAPDLSNQQITTTTVYGVVTLSGSVETEAMRTEAETIASRAAGVQKVVDEMTLSSDAAAPQQAPDSGAAQVNNGQLQSDGTMAPTAPPDQSQAAPNSQAPNQANGPNYGPGAPEYRQPYRGPYAPPPPPGYPAYPKQPNYSQQPNYPQQPSYSQQPNYPPQPGYPQYGAPRPSYAPPQGYNGAPQPVYGGQQEGQIVTIPNGAMIRIRVNQSLDSGRTQPGERFDGIVVNDVVADGAIAIPRGAAVQGTVVDATKSGALHGRGSLSLELTQVSMGGKTYPVQSDVWTQNGGDKTTETVDKTAIGGAIGALIGAAAGGGEGAAIGAGVGAAAGLGSSAASGNGGVYVPSEGMLTFHLARPVTVATVSQQEMDRLAQSVGPGPGGPQTLRRRAVYPAYGPIYYQPYPPYAPYPYYPYPH
jgi:BON domain